MSPFNFRILVVDDYPSTQAVSKAILETKGYEVHCASDCFAALLALKDSLPDLIISDLRMPRMSGFELLSVVRRRFPQIPVIAISANFSGEDVPSGVLADAFFQKAITLRRGSLKEWPNWCGFSRSARAQANSKLLKSGEWRARAKRCLPLPAITASAVFQFACQPWLGRKKRTAIFAKPRWSSFARRCFSARAARRRIVGWLSNRHALRNFAALHWRQAPATALSAVAGRRSPPASFPQGGLGGSLL